MIAEYAVWEAVLLAATKLPETFSAEELVMSAWKEWPIRFGLKGFEDKSADSNKILASVMGERGLVRRGQLVNVGKKMYSVTREGRKLAARLNGEPFDEPEPDHLELSKELGKFLLGLLSSSAYHKFEENQRNELSFSDACKFWYITQDCRDPDSVIKAVELRLNDLERLLAYQDARLSSGRMVSSGDIRCLRNISRFMADRFDRLLNLLRNRR